MGTLIGAAVGAAVDFAVYTTALIVDYIRKKLIILYITALGINPFEKWFSKLDPIAAAKIATALYRLEMGNYSNVKNLHDGIFEYKIDFGPGYRIYFGQDGEELVILVGGGTKKQEKKL